MMDASSPSVLQAAQVQDRREERHTHNCFADLLPITAGLILFLDPLTLTTEYTHTNIILLHSISSSSRLSPFVPPGQLSARSARS